MGGGGGGETQTSVEIPQELKKLYRQTGERMLKLQKALPMIGQSQWYKDNKQLYVGNPEGMFAPRPGIDPLTGYEAELPVHMGGRDRLAEAAAAAAAAGGGGGGGGGRPPVPIHNAPEHTQTMPSNVS